jgi:hypothetical protein
MAGGCLAAHSFAYHLVSTREERHGYLAFAPLLIGVLAALALVGAFRRTHGRQTPLVFAALPPLAFVVQEHAERLELVVTEPAFMVGLALQLPFALAALVAARAFLGLADLIVEAFAARPPRLRRARQAPAPVASAETPRPSFLAGSRLSRAPPAVA